MLGKVCNRGGKDRGRCNRKGTCLIGRELQGEGNRRGTAGNVGDREYVPEMHVFPCTAFPPRSSERTAGSVCNGEGTAGNMCNGEGTGSIGPPRHIMFLADQR